MGEFLAHFSTAFWHENILHVIVVHAINCFKHFSGFLLISMVAISFFVGKLSYFLTLSFDISCRQRLCRISIFLDEFLREHSLKFEYIKLFTRAIFSSFTVYICSLLMAAIGTLLSIRYSKKDVQDIKIFNSTLNISKRNVPNNQQTRFYNSTGSSCHSKSNKSCYRAVLPNLSSLIFRKQIEPKNQFFRILRQNKYSFFATAKLFRAVNYGFTRLLHFTSKIKKITFEKVLFSICNL